MKTRFVLLTIILLFSLIGCSEPPVTTQRQEQTLSEENQARLLESQPPPKLDFSLERENLSERTTRFNDRNKQSYIYLLSDMGQIYAFLTIKGKVSSVNSFMTTPDQIVCRYSGSCVVVESPAEDGSYGSNGDAIFFFLTDGTYIEWNGKYLLADRPMQLTEQPLIIYEEQK